MNEFFVLAYDTQTEQIVHIEEVAQGYKDCICPECRDSLIAANHNPETRKNRMYFRHVSGASCSQESALHLYAKSIITKRLCVNSPEFIKRFSRKLSNFDLINREFTQPSEVFQLVKSLPEQTIQLDDQQIRPDLTCELLGGVTLYVEICVTSKKSKEHVSLLEQYQLTTMEINLEHLLNMKEYLSRDLLEEIVIHSSDRKWLFIDWFDEDIALIEKEINEIPDIVIALDISNSDDEKSLDEFNLELDEPYANTNGLENEYDDDDKYHEYEEKNKALLSTRLKLESYMDAYTNNSIRQNVQGIFNKKISDQVPLTRIPSCLNIRLEGELAFKEHRFYWQRAVFNCLLDNRYKELSKYDVLSYVLNYIELSRSGELIYKYHSEPIRYNPQTNIYEYLWEHCFISYEDTPCPVRIMHTYLIKLFEIGWVSYGNGVFHLPYNRVKEVELLLERVDYIKL